VAVSNLAELPAWAAELLGDAQVARLGLLDIEGHPRVLPVTFALTQNRIWSAVDAKPKRVAPDELARLRFLRRDPRVALMIDRYSDDWDALAWVQLLGEIRIVDLAEGVEGMRALAGKYRQYRETPPPGPLLALEPRRCLCWRASGDE
jgi:PPOX class probable F420-dependent enzyme